MPLLAFNPCTIKTPFYVPYEKMMSSFFPKTNPKETEFLFYALEHNDHLGRVHEPPVYLLY